MAPRPNPFSPWPSVVIALLVSASCTQQGDYFGTTKPRHGPETIWINNSSEPEYIDPGKCSESSGSTVTLNIFSGLTQPHPKTLQPMPDIAKGWTIEDGGRTYIFHLRQSTWSDGHPLTAHDFEWSWKRTLDAKTASKYASFLYPLRYGEPFHQRALYVQGLSPEITADQLESKAKPLVTSNASL